MGNVFACIDDQPSQCGAPSYSCPLPWFGAHTHTLPTPGSNAQANKRNRPPVLDGGPALRHKWQWKILFAGCCPVTVK